MRYLLHIVVLILLAAGVRAQNVSFTVACKKVVATGEQFRMVFAVNAKGSGLKLPSMKDFDILAGPSTSQSSNIQFINGQVSQQVNFSYTYVLRAQKEGKFDIESAEITVDGETYKTSPFQIEVVKGATNTSPQGNQNTHGTNQTQAPQSDQISGNDLFVRVNVSKTSVFQGEHIYANIKLYTRHDLSGLENYKLPTFAGFYAHDIESPQQFTLVSENVNGTVYNTASMKKVLLIPQRSGEIVIDAAEIDCLIRQRVKSQRRSIFDSFFGNYKNVKVSIKSPEVKINVKPLPGNKPATFSGAVGSFSMNASIDNNLVKTDEAISYKLKISGNGNIKLIDPPDVNFPSDFEVYDPKIDNNISATSGGVSGSKTIEYLLIPRYAGEFNIPAVSLSYFDINSKSYKTLRTEEFNITVEKGEGEEIATVVSNMTKEDIIVLGQDIRFIKTNDITLSEKGKTLFGSAMFFLSYVIALLLFFIILIIWRKHIKRSSDIAMVKNRKANKVSQKRLKTARTLLQAGNNEEFYEEILKALWGYLSDKMNIPVSELSKESTMSSLKNYKVEDELLADLVKIIDICEYARYSPISESSQMDSVYKDASGIIGKLEQKLK